MQPSTATSSDAATSTQSTLTVRRAVPMDLVEVITMAASQDRITGMAALLLPPLSLSAVFATATGGHGNGWLYEVLVKVGVPDDSATTISNILVRPLEIILIALITWMVARLGARVIRRLLTTAAKPATARSDSPRAELRVHSVVSLIANVWRVVVFFVGLRHGDRCHDRLRGPTACA